MNNYNNQSILELKSIFCNKVSSNDIFETDGCEIIVFTGKETRNGILIDIKSKIIGNYQISLLYKVLAWLKSIDFQNGEIFISLPEDLENFSSAFVSTVYLLNKGFNSEIYIYGQDSNSRTYEFIHMMYSGQLAPESDYFFKINTYSQPNDIPKIWGLINRGNANRYVASEKNLPLIPITQTNNQELFIKTLSSYLSDNISSLISVNVYDYKTIFNKFQNSYSSDESKLDDFKRKFYALHFLRLLDNLHCLKYYCLEKSGVKIDDYYYQNIYSTIIIPLFNAPVFLSLIVYLLVDEKSVKDNFIQIYNNETNETRKIFNKKIILLESTNTTHLQILQAYSDFLLTQLQLATEIYKGVFELVKNTVEHSTNKRGVLTVRRIKRYELLKTKNENENIWAEYTYSVSKLNFIEKEDNSFIDISIVDDGEIGIIERSLEELHKLGNKTKRQITKEIAEEDILKIENELTKNEAELLFKMYFKPNEFFLTRQAHRAMGSYGLFIFTKFIRENNGIFNVQTNSVRNKLKTVSFYNSLYLENYINITYQCPFGTLYNITIPIIKQEIKKKGEYILIKSDKEEETTPPDSLFRRMLTFDPNRKPYLKKSDETYEINAEIIRDIKSDDEIILLISIDKGIDRSGLLRLLFKVFVDDKINAIIVRNINVKLLNDYLDLFFDFSEIDKKLLPKSKAIFFYLDDQPQSLFVLAGESLGECNKVYSTIKNNKLHDSTYKYHQIDLDDNCQEFPRHLTSKNNPLFVDRNLIVRLDFLEIDEEGLTKFEQKAKQHLETDINNNGYKWSDTHLKIGSKLHLKDFIYGKKLFQKNYEASRFAYSLAIHIFYQEYSRKKEKKEKSNEQINYTIIGYGFYSELLVSRVREFVGFLFDYTKQENEAEQIISYAIVKDEEEIKFSKFFRELHCRNEKAIEKIVVIVPISSTLTTCLKIENAFKKAIKDKTNIGKHDRFEIFSPFYSVVVVGDGNEDELELKVKDEKSILSHYWDDISIKDKIIYTINREQKIANRESKRENHYKLYLKSEWEHVEDCNKCFPDNPLEEKPLFMTDKVAVTPSLVFSAHTWQKSEDINGDSVYFCLDKECIRPKDRKYIDDTMLNVVHYKGQDKDFLYYLRYNEIVDGNRIEIEKWAVKLHDKDIFNKSKIISKEILLIAPDKSENGDFIHLINRCLFQERANVIKVDPYGDYYSNFDKFFGAEIDKANDIFFVDNLIATGNTISNIYDNLLIIRDNVDDKIKGVITLLNRMDYESYKRFSTKIKKKDIFSFIEINVPVITNPRRFCPICEDEKVYIQLSEDSSLDIIRQYFNKKELPNTTPISKEDLIEGRTFEGKNRKSSVLKLMLVHYLNKAFSENDIVVDPLRKETINPNSTYNFNIFSKDFREYIIRKETCNLENISDIRFKSNIIKILAQYPFKRYRGINIAVFYWILNDLVSISNQILGVNNYKIDNKFEVLKENFICEDDNEFIDSVNYLRVLIKYGSILKISYLLHKDFLLAMNTLINSAKFKSISCNEILQNNKQQGNLSPQTEDSNTLNNKSSLINFRIFTVAHIAKSLQGVEGRSIRLEETLWTLKINDFEDNSFLDILTLENTIIIKEFIDGLKSLDKCSSIDKSICQSYKHDSKIKNYISFFENSFREKVEIIDMEIHTLSFKIFITDLFSLNQFIETHVKKKGDENKFEDEAKELTQKVGKVLGFDMRNGGGFLMYKYQDIKADDSDDKNTIVLGKTGDTSIADIFENGIPSNSVTLKMLKGFEYIHEDKVKYTWTNFSIVKDEIKGWIGQNNNHDDAYETTIIEKDYNRIIFCRISDFINQENTENEPDMELNGRGVFVFYDNSIRNKDRWSINRVRYIHVFRKKILHLFEKKYNSDSFRAWIDEKEKLAYKKVLWHGNDKLLEKLDDYKNQMLDNENKYKFDIILKLLRDKFKYEVKDVNNNQEKISFMICKKYTYSKTPFLCISSISSLVEEILSINKFSLKNNITINMPEAIKVNSNKLFITIIAYELIYNAIKNAKESGRTAKLVSILFNVENSNLVFQISNTSSYLSSEEINLINKHGFKKKAGGLELSKHFLKALGSNIPVVKYNDYTYTATITFKNILQQ